MDVRWDKTIKREVYHDDTYSLRDISFDRDPLHIIDIGSNYGWFSYLAAEMYPECNIYAYELMEDNYKAAETNLSKFKNVKLFNAGVIGNNSIVKICENRDNRGGHKSIYSGDGSYNSEERFKSTKPSNSITKCAVEQISIKEIFEINNIDYVDFLKVDCEGCEFEVFDQIFKHDLDKRIKNISMEVHGAGHPEYENLKKELTKRFSTCKWGKITKARNE